VVLTGKTQRYNECQYVYKLRLCVASSVVVRTAAGTLSPSGTIGEVSAVYLNPSGFSLENFKIKTDGRVMAEASLKFTESLKFNASIGKRYLNSLPVHWL
jgi:hypothetical protein